MRHEPRQGGATRNRRAKDVASSGDFQLTLCSHGTRVQNWERTNSCGREPPSWLPFVKAALGN